VAVPLRVVGADGLPGESLTLLGVRADNPYFAVDVDALGAQELVISRTAAHKYRLGAGDTLTLHDGEISWAFDVVGVSDYTTSAFGFTAPEHARASPTVRSWRPHRPKRWRESSTAPFMAMSASGWAAGCCTARRAPTTPAQYWSLVTQACPCARLSPSPTSGPEGRCR